MHSRMQPGHGMRNAPWVGEWLLGNALGGAIAGVLEVRLQFLGTLVLAGGIVGVGQAWAWRRWGKFSLGWAIATALAWPLANALEVSLLARPVSALAASLSQTGWLWEVFWLNLVRMPVVVGLVAIPQALLLRRYWPHRWSGWIVGSVLAGAALGGVGAAVCWGWCDRLSPEWAGVLVGGMGWLGYGLCLCPLLRPAAPTQENP